jgi:subtilisin family serine protease
VASQLQALGFHVFDIPGVVVFARGRVDRFEEIFGGHLVRLTREVLPGGRRRRTMTRVVLQPGTELGSPERIAGALLVTVAEPPRLAKPRAPRKKVATATKKVATATTDYCLRLPTGVARITKASKIHGRLTPSGDLATGGGVTVAVIDTGFADHSYFRRRAYHITRQAAPDTDFPEIDEQGHGTPVLATFLACAPDATVHAIKYDNTHIALGFAMGIPHVRVITLTSYSSPPVFDQEEIAVRFLIGLAVALQNITVVVATGNDAGGESFPANVPEVISVGGVSVDSSSALKVWDGSTSFRSAAGRAAPDLCGVASQIHMPMPQVEPGKKNPWTCTEGGTSLAVPQVAAIATLLIQKQPVLTPSAVKTVLASQGTDICAGHSATGDVATPGPDLATGGGLVNALKAWSNV